MRIVRTTGVAGGLLIALLGIWGALIPFVGPYFNYSFGVNSTWHYTADRLWLDILPGAVALLAGLVLLEARTRSTAAVGAWLAIFAGTWFVIGPSVSLTWEHGAGPIGPPLYGTTRQMLELLGYFYLVGALIVGLAAFVLGRLVPAHVVEPAPAGAGRARTRGYAPGEPGYAPAGPGYAPGERGYAPEERGYAPEEPAASPSEARPSEARPSEAPRSEARPSEAARPAAGPTTGAAPREGRARGRIHMPFARRRQRA